MVPLLWTSYFRYLQRNLWLLLFSVCAIATGVAVILAIDVASVSAKRSFALSLEALTGKSNYAVVGTGHGIEESFYKTVRMDWSFRSAAPVVEGYVTVPGSDLSSPTTEPISLTVLGVEPFADLEVRSWTGGGLQSSEDTSANMASLIGSQDNVVATQATAARLGWAVSESKEVVVGSKRTQLVLAGVFQPASERSSAALDNVLLTDISVAQAIFGKYGFLDRIDLILSEEQKESLEQRLPEGLFLQAAGQSQRTATELSSAFHTNLRALSYLCLLVATFLIFNVVSFTVAHRRQSLGRLRILGVTGGELAKLLLGESLFLGLLGSSLGTAAGLVLGRLLVPLVSRSLNDLYYVHAITQFYIDPLLLGKAFGCGLLATLIAAAHPARSVARTEPLELLRRVSGQRASWRTVSASFCAGCATLGLAFLVLIDESLPAGLFSLLLIVLGTSLLIPALLLFCSQAMDLVISRVSHKMAIRGVTAFLGRTSLAVVALSVAVAATISIAMMVSSFRGTLTSWLETTLTADIYLTLKDKAGLAAGAALDPHKVGDAVVLPGVSAWIGQRLAQVPSSTGETFLVGVRVAGRYKESLVFLEQTDDSWARFERGEGIFVTEPYARRSALTVGENLILATPSGSQTLPVLGVYYSYAPDRNMALMEASKFEDLFQDDGWSGLGLYLDEGVEAEQTTQQLQRLFGEEVEIRATGNLKALALEIFERTFTVTEVLRFLALGVAFVGVNLSLLALSFERTQEVSVLRALGLDRKELFQLSLLQSMFLGVVAGVVAFPLGTLLSRMMIDVINRRAFGWTITFQTDWGAIVESFALALGAAFLAGLYPAWKWSRGNEQEGLRERE